MTKTIELDENKETLDGLICYTDGGSRPNGSYVGWGFHGYTYSEEKPKKGAGILTHFPTASGYVAKSEKDTLSIPEVKPIQYFDGYGSQQEFGTNNLAELLAINLATTKALDLDIKKLLIRTDSEYIRKGVNDWSHNWVRNNWKKADGSVVPNSNKWISLLKNIGDLKNKNVEFKVEWVKGHSDRDNSRPDVYGNIVADRLATVGVIGSINGESMEHVTIKNAEGYWKSTVEKNPLIDHKRLYFNTLDESSVPGEYYLGNHGRDDDMLGKKMADGTYSVIKLKEKDPIIELIKDYHTSMSGHLDTIVMIRLDCLFKQLTYEYIENYGKNALVRKKRDRLDLYTLNDEPLTREIRPPKLAMRAIDALSSLKAILYNYIEGNVSEYSLIDLTDHFYEKVEIVKPKSTTIKCSLKKEFGSGILSLPLAITVEDKEVPVILTLGVDCPSRNSLKAMEDNEPKITLITWKEALGVLRYCTIVENNTGVGIWAGVYSNIVFIK